MPEVLCQKIKNRKKPNPSFYPFLKKPNSILSLNLLFLIQIMLVCYCVPSKSIIYPISVSGIVIPKFSSISVSANLILLYIVIFP